MSDDPEICNTDSPTTILDNEPCDRFWERPRWQKFGGRKPPMTPARVRAIAAKRSHENNLVALRARERNAVDITKCLSGNELVAERKYMGDGASFKLGLFGATSSLKLSWLDAKILAAVAYAMCSKGLQALLVTLAELRQVLGMGQTAIGDSIRKLEAHAKLKVDPSFVEFHAVTNQRGNFLRLTRQCVEEFRLYVPQWVDVPEGTVDPTWRPRTRDGSRGFRSPEANPDLGHTDKKTGSPSGMASALPCDRSAVSAAPTRNLCPEAVANESSAASDLKRVKARREPFPDRTEPESRAEIRAVIGEDLAELISSLRSKVGES